MSALSHCLTEVMEKSGLSQTDWAQRCQIHATLLSRYRTGKIRPDTSGLERLLQGAPKEYQAQLLASYLKDDVPQDYAHLVLVSITSGKIQEDPAPYEFNELNRKTQKAFMHLIRLAVKDTDAQAAVQSTARYLGCKI